MIADGNGSFPFVMVGGVLEAKTKWNIGKEVTDSILKTFPGACPIIPKVSSFLKQYIIWPKCYRINFLLSVAFRKRRIIIIQLIVGLLVLD